MAMYGQARSEPQESTYSSQAIIQPVLVGGSYSLSCNSLIITAWEEENRRSFKLHCDGMVYDTLPCHQLYPIYKTVIDR
jgi:hypothetical protein